MTFRACCFVAFLVIVWGVVGRFLGAFLPCAGVCSVALFGALYRAPVRLLVHRFCIGCLVRVCETVIFPRCSSYVFVVWSRFF